LHYNTLQHTTTRCNTLQHYNTLQHTATRIASGHGDGDFLHAQWTRSHLNTLQHTATHCNTLQHTLEVDMAVEIFLLLEVFFTLHHAATHCHTLQHTATDIGSGYGGGDFLLAGIFARICSGQLYRDWDLLTIFWRGVGL